MAIEPHLLAADGDDVVEGVEPPTDDERLAFLARHGFTSETPAALGWATEDEHD